MSNQDPLVCRPGHITRKWVHEMTEGIKYTCPSAPSPVPLEPSHYTPEQAWTHYLKTLYQHQCMKNPKVQDILQYKTDCRLYQTSWRYRAKEAVGRSIIGTSDAIGSAALMVAQGFIHATRAIASIFASKP